VNAADTTDRTKPSDGPASSAETKLSSGEKCPACAKPIDAGTTRCPHCGLAIGEHQRCPHCHAVADVEPSSEARFVCAVCGGVRIPIEDAKVVRSAETLDALKRATTARSARSVWRIVAILVAAFGAFSGLVLWVTLSFADPPAVAKVVAGLAVAVPFAFAIFAGQRSRACAAIFAPALDKAWIAAAADIARSRGGELDAAELAKLTRIAEADADKLLSRMSAQSLLASSVTSEGGLKYTLVDAGAGAREKSLPATR
jgi:hypothetical protein